ncbi:hypothetical protein B0H10DRAFT_1949356 [Mycena sp. CBHHK59/15]|nr:hypothetical protein B0H10DRAFT_1949356 [Mycena sp. CBHHK59/15]
MRLAPEVLFEFIPQFLRDGWQVCVERGERHGVTPAPGARAADDEGRYAKAWKAWGISDMWYAQDRLGPERVKGLYAFRSIIASGAKITLGSDFPVETMNPLAGFYAAITRVSLAGDSPHGPGGWSVPRGTSNAGGSSAR